jgi:ketosteroid isomerase-like protein
MSSPSPREVFHQVVTGVAERRYDELPELYADQTDVRHPMSPTGDQPLRSRADVRGHFGRAAGMVASVRFRPENIVVHETTDPEVVVAEFEYRGTRPESGEEFTAPCIFVLRVRDGLIVESRDYVDHVAMARARGDLGELLDRLR